MRTYTLERQQWIDRPIGEVFDFFSRAENLAAITPPWLGFDLRTPVPIEMRTGARIEYRIALAGVPLSWRTRIEEWKPGVRFVDLQERGPYRLWEHLHEFDSMGGGVLMRDRVRYALPFGLLGRVAHTLAVRAALNAIFDYRYDRIGEIHL
jgi:ligand-binding SRPBCC domain-containing protein